MTATFDRKPTGPSASFLAGDVDAYARTRHVPTDDDHDRARRVVASRATDVDDCARLLDMLGLLPEGNQR